VSPRFDQIDGEESPAAWKRNRMDCVMQVKEI
jgi:hypothetical protein